MKKASSLSPEILAFIEAVPDMYLILATDLTILGASKAYLEVSHSSLSEIKGRYLFDVFPDNPALSNADGVLNLRKSLEWVIKK